MPSFAKTLNHHLPPWATVKTRLKSLALACTCSQTQTTVPKDSGPTYMNKENLHLEERPHMHDLDLGETELQSLESVKYIGGGAPESFDDDRVLLEA